MSHSLLNSGHHKGIGGYDHDNECPKNARGHGTTASTQPRQTAGLRLVETPAPNAVNETKRPKRLANVDRRPREHLSKDEVLLLVRAARKNRHGPRDAAAIWVAFNHGLRVSELVDLRWSDVRWDERVMMVRRLKGSASGEHNESQR